MIAATSRRRGPLDPHRRTMIPARLGELRDVPTATHWVEPGTRQIYPMSYPAYRRTREAEDRRPPRHRSLGPDVDHYLCRRWRARAEPEVAVRLTMRPDTPPRIRRIVNEILRAIRRGQPAGDARTLLARQRPGGLDVRGIVTGLSAAISGGRR